MNFKPQFNKVAQQTLPLRNPIQKLIALDKKNTPSDSQIMYYQLYLTLYLPRVTRIDNNNNINNDRMLKNATPEDDLETFWKYINSFYFRDMTNLDLNRIDLLISQLHIDREGNRVFNFFAFLNGLFSILNTILFVVYIVSEEFQKEILRGPFEKILCEEIFVNFF